MLSLVQFLIAIFAIYSALTFQEGLKFLIPLSCLIVMFIIGRIDKRNSEKKTVRRIYLKKEIDKGLKKESTVIKEKDFFTIESLLWPKSELLLIDAVHSIFKDLGFRISTGINYQSVDRIIRIPNIQVIFGVHILMSEEELEGNHPKIVRALQFEGEKKGKEKTLIIASTHIHQPLLERSQLSHISKEMGNFLMRHNISLITTHHLYELWQKAKDGEIDIFGFFQKIYSEQGGILPLQKSGKPKAPLFELPA